MATTSHKTAVADCPPSSYIRECRETFAAVCVHVWPAPWPRRVRVRVVLAAHGTKPLAKP